MVLNCNELTAPAYGAYILGVVPSAGILLTKRMAFQANQTVVIRNWL